MLLAATAGAQDWHEAYRAGLAALARGDHARAAEALRRAIALHPEPGRNVLTYGTNVEPRYFPYLRLAEACLALGQLDAAGEALARSAAWGTREPADERQALARPARAAAMAGEEPPAPPPAVAAPTAAPTRRPRPRPRRRPTPTAGADVAAPGRGHASRLRFRRASPGASAGAASAALGRSPDAGPPVRSVVEAPRPLGSLEVLSDPAGRLGLRRRRAGRLDRPRDAAAW